MPAFFATTHWEGTPSMESLACFTSLYSCWPAWERVGGNRTGWRSRNGFKRQACRQGQASRRAAPPSANQPLTRVRQHNQDDLCGAAKGLACSVSGAPHRLRGGAPARRHDAWRQRGGGGLHAARVEHVDEFLLGGGGDGLLCWACCASER
jgi:hypothetical protein